MHASKLRAVSTSTATELSSYCIHFITFTTQFIYFQLEIPQHFATILSQFVLTTRIGLVKLFVDGGLEKFYLIN